MVELVRVKTIEISCAALVGDDEEKSAQPENFKNTAVAHDETESTEPVGQNSTKEPSTARLVVILGGLWVWRSPSDYFGTDVTDRFVAWSPSCGAG